MRRLVGLRYPPREVAIVDDHVSDSDDDVFQSKPTGPKRQRLLDGTGEDATGFRNESSPTPQTSVTTDSLDSLIIRGVRYGELSTFPRPFAEDFSHFSFEVDEFDDFPDAMETESFLAGGDKTYYWDSGFPSEMASIAHDIKWELRLLSISTDALPLSLDSCLRVRKHVEACKFITTFMEGPLLLGANGTDMFEQTVASLQDFFSALEMPYSVVVDDKAHPAALSSLVCFQVFRLRWARALAKNDANVFVQHARAVLLSLMELLHLGFGPNSQSFASKGGRVIISSISSLWYKLVHECDAQFEDGGFWSMFNSVAKNPGIFQEWMGNAPSTDINEFIWEVVFTVVGIRAQHDGVAGPANWHLIERLLLESSLSESFDSKGLAMRMPSRGENSLLRSDTGVTVEYSRIVVRRSYKLSEVWEGDKDFVFALWRLIASRTEPTKPKIIDCAADWSKFPSPEQLENVEHVRFRDTCFHSFLKILLKHIESLSTNGGENSPSAGRKKNTKVTKLVSRFVLHEIPSNNGSVRLTQQELVCCVQAILACTVRCPNLIGTAVQRMVGFVSGDESPIWILSTVAHGLVWLLKFTQRTKECIAVIAEHLNAIMRSAVKRLSACLSVLKGTSTVEARDIEDLISWSLDEIEGVFREAAGEFACSEHTLLDKWMRDVLDPKLSVHAELKRRALAVILASELPHDRAIPTAIQTHADEQPPPNHVEDNIESQESLFDDFLDIDPTMIDDMVTQHQKQQDPAIKKGQQLVAEAWQTFYQTFQDVVHARFKKTKGFQGTSSLYSSIDEGVFARTLECWGRMIPRLTGHPRFRVDAIIETFGPKSWFLVRSSTVSHRQVPLRLFTALLSSEIAWNTSSTVAEERGDDILSLWILTMWEFCYTEQFTMTKLLRSSRNLTLQRVFSSIPEDLLISSQVFSNRRAEIMSCVFRQLCSETQMDWARPQPDSSKRRFLGIFSNSNKVIGQIIKELGGSQQKEAEYMRYIYASIGNALRYCYPIIYGGHTRSSENFLEGLIAEHYDRQELSIFEASYVESLPGLLSGLAGLKCYEDENLMKMLVVVLKSYMYTCTGQGLRAAADERFINALAVGLTGCKGILKAALDEDVMWTRCAVIWNYLTKWMGDGRRIANIPASISSCRLLNKMFVLICESNDPNVASAGIISCKENGRFYRDTRLSTGCAKVDTLLSDFICVMSSLLDGLCCNITAYPIALLKVSLYDLVQCVWSKANELNHGINLLDFEDGAAVTCTALQQFVQAVVMQSLRDLFWVITYGSQLDHQYIQELAARVPSSVQINQVKACMVQYLFNPVRLIPQAASVRSRFYIPTDASPAAMDDVRDHLTTSMFACLAELFHSSRFGRRVIISVLPLIFALIQNNAYFQRRGRMHIYLRFLDSIGPPGLAYRQAQDKTEPDEGTFIRTSGIRLGFP